MKSTIYGNSAGTGAALNIPVGFIPDRVEIINNLGSTPVVNIGYPRRKKIAYTSESGEIKAGMKIIGATSGATALVLQVIRDTGTVAGGDAAGWLIIDAETEIGTFAAESGYFDGSATLNDITLAASAVNGVDVILATASDLGITAYKGSTTEGAGFTIATGISVDGELLAWEASRND